MGVAWSRVEGRYEWLLLGYGLPQLDRVNEPAFDPAQPLAHAYTPRQLTLLPPEYRNAVLEASALLAEDIYLNGAMNEDGYGQSSRDPTKAR